MKESSHLDWTRKSNQHHHTGTKFGVSELWRLTVFHHCQVRHCSDELSVIELKPCRQPPESVSPPRGIYARSPSQHSRSDNAANASKGKAWGTGGSESAHICPMRSRHS
jgi:hypothetical protein